MRRALPTLLVAASAIVLLGARPRLPKGPLTWTDPRTGEKKVVSVCQPVIDLYPGPDQDFGPGSIRLSWHAVEHATRYRVQLARDGEFHSILFDRTQSSLDTTTGSLGPGHYWWRVQSIDQFGGWADWSTVNDFRVHAAGEAAKATLHWRPGRLVGLTYRVEISTDPRFKSINASSKTDDAFYVTPPLRRGHYYWRVLTVDEDGKKLDATKPRFFDVHDGFVTYGGE